MSEGITQITARILREQITDQEKRVAEAYAAYNRERRLLHDILHQWHELKEADARKAMQVAP